MVQTGECLFLSIWLGKWKSDDMQVQSPGLAGTSRPESLLVLGPEEQHIDLLPYPPALPVQKLEVLVALAKSCFSKGECRACEESWVCFRPLNR